MLYAVCEGTSRSTIALQVRTYGQQHAGSTNMLTADINPIGAISKTDLKRFIAYAQGAFNLPILEQCVARLKFVSIAERDSCQIPDGGANRRARTDH